MNRAPRLMAILSLEVGAAPASTPEGHLVSRALTLARAGVDCIQLRDKRATDRQVYECARATVEALATSSTAEGAQTGEPAARPPRVLVNRRPDISSSAGAAGVHLPAQGLPTRAVRDAFGEDFVIGRSTHSLEEVAQAQRQGADYVVFGPVFETPKKLRYGVPLGLEQLRRAVAIGIPVLAIGGINEERLALVAQAGAAGAAAIRLFENTDLVPSIVESARALFDGIGAPAHV